jgi:DNA-binding GntR family transcriptional regulator
VEVRQTGLADRVHEFVLANIGGGHWMPGMKVNESQLAKQLGVSRIPVREAMERLHRDGWVERIPNRGIFVKDVDAQFIEDLFLAREVIEVGSATRLATGLSPEQKQLFDDVLKARHEAWNNMELAKLRQTDKAFHLLIVRLGGGARLATVFESVLMQSNGMLFNNRDHSPFSAGQLGKYYVSHKEILDAIVEGNVSKTKKYLTKHIKQARLGTIKTWEFFEEMRRIETRNETVRLAGEQIKKGAGSKKGERQ